MDWDLLRKHLRGRETSKGREGLGKLGLHKEGTWRVELGSETSSSFADSMEK